MNRPQVLGVYPTQDKAVQASLDPYYKRLGAQVADLGEHSPVVGKPWALIVPPPVKNEKKDL
jgi:hypothetical protein